MGKLKPLPAKVVIKKLKKIGYFIERQKGSHIRMHNNHNSRSAVTVPMHGSRDVSKDIIRKIIRDAHITIDEFNDL
jgi:predicted RNA binding protein YcfA (HicA-like mRNA interferase family)